MEMGGLDSEQRRALVNTAMQLWVLYKKLGNFLTSWVTMNFSKRTLLHVVSTDLRSYLASNEMRGRVRTIIK